MGEDNNNGNGKFSFKSAEQIHRLESAFARAGGWDHALVEKLISGDILVDMKSVLYGCSEIKPVRHLIDSDAEPYTPAGWKIETHHRMGVLTVNPGRIKLFRTEKQLREKKVSGLELQKELKSKKILNANFLDHFLRFPEMIPDFFEKDSPGITTVYVFFWGTKYRDREDRLCVRCLRRVRSEETWKSDWAHVDNSFYAYSPAAILK